jgi:hypothetical protein
MKTANVQILKKKKQETTASDVRILNAFSA